jgi:hypothetical protein
MGKEQNRSPDYVFKATGDVRETRRAGFDREGDSPIY